MAPKFKDIGRGHTYPGCPPQKIRGQAPKVKLPKPKK